MIGVFDSGFGGLSILKEILKVQPQYDYLYLGDTARAPYGNRSPEVIYNWTREAMDFLFGQGCELVILGCFTASAVALRRLQKEWLLEYCRDTACRVPTHRILGVLIPLAEAAGEISRFGRIGILGTRATIQSGALETELKKRRKNLRIFSQSAPLLVPLIEEGWLHRPETKKILRYYLRPLKQKRIDTLLLACTHYPLISQEISAVMGRQVKVIHPGQVVAEKLTDYLKRHPEMETKLAKNSQRRFLTTDRVEDFQRLGSRFLGETIKAEKVEI